MAMELGSAATGSAWTVRLTGSAAKPRSRGEIWRAGLSITRRDLGDALRPRGGGVWEGLSRSARADQVKYGASMFLDR